MMLSRYFFPPQQMAGCPICPVLLEQMSLPQWPLWPGNASPLLPYTPASQSSSPLTSPCATHTTAPSPTVLPRTTSYSISAWAGRGRAQGKGHNHFSVLLEFPVIWWCRSTYRFTTFPLFRSSYTHRHSVTREGHSWAGLHIDLQVNVQHVYISLFIV